MENTSVLRNTWQGSREIIESGGPSNLTEMLSILSAVSEFLTEFGPRLPQGKLSVSFSIGSVLGQCSLFPNSYLNLSESLGWG